MTNKIGVVISYGCYGGKAIAVENLPHHSVSIALPDCLKDIPVGFIAYIDHDGKLDFLEEDPE